MAGYVERLYDCRREDQSWGRGVEDKRLVKCCSALEDGCVGTSSGIV